MTKTTNYQLNQWEPHDPIRRQDFNADNCSVKQTCRWQVSVHDSRNDKRLNRGSVSQTAMLAGTH